MKTFKKIFTVAVMFMAIAFVISASSCSGIKHGSCQANKIGNHPTH
jgi:hypothetical protein